MECREIILFETLVVLGGITYKKKIEFFHSTQKLIEETGIRRHTVDKILQRFIDLGIIELEVKGIPQVKHIKIIWEKILELLPKIYRFDKVEKYFSGSVKSLTDFYQSLAENNKMFTENGKEENIKENIDREYKEELYANALDMFRQYLDNFFGGSVTVRSQFDENDFYEALKIYSYEEIIDAIPYEIDNFDNQKRDMRIFFSMNEMGKIMSIEKRIFERKEKNESILNRFKKIMEERISYYNKINSPTYKLNTSFPINENIIPRIKRVFEKKAENDVYNAFIAFCDDFLKGKLNIKRDVLGYFLSEKNGEFPVVDMYQIFFLASYTC